jgi:hypothetical protein
VRQLLGSIAIQCISHVMLPISSFSACELVGLLATASGRFSQAHKLTSSHSQLQRQSICNDCFRCEQHHGRGQ